MNPLCPIHYKQLDDEGKCRWCERQKMIADSKKRRYEAQDRLIERLKDDPEASKDLQIILDDDL